MVDRHRVGKKIDWTRPAHPAASRWRARFAAETLNDTGRRGVGRRTTDNAVQIRRVSDGALLRTITAADIGSGVQLGFVDLVWEDTGHILFPVYDATGGTLVRCGIHAECTTASTHHPGGFGSFSIPGIRSY